MESGCARYERYGTAAGKGPKTDMKHNNQKEILSILVSALLALVLFCILLFCLKWNLFLCMLLTAGVYLALSLLLRPVLLPSVLQELPSVPPALPLVPLLVLRFRFLLLRLRHKHYH